MPGKQYINWLVCVSIVLIAVSAFPAGCQKKVPAGGTGLSGTITEAGSTTIQPLAEKLAHDFTGKYPAVDVVIQGGGSSVGIKSTSDGTVDIGATSRDLQPPEEGNLEKFLLAYDGIAIIVNTQNNISGLTKQQVRDIFSGKITNWSQVGGTNKPIVVSAREEGSGTRAYFDETIMGKDLITDRAILEPSSGALVQVVAREPRAISFVSFGYLNDQVKALAIDGMIASEANAKNKIYPIVRPLYFLTRGQPQGLVKAFIDFCATAEAQAIVSEEGYIAIQ